jgi:hypothetical protein
MRTLFRWREWPMSSQILIPYLLIGAFFSALISAAIFWYGIGGGFFAVFVSPCFAIGALIVIGSGVADGWRSRKNLRRAIVTAVVPLLGVCLSPIAFVIVMSTTDHAFVWGIFAVNQHSYARIVDLAAHNRLPRQTRPAPQFAADGTAFEAERKPPHRIAFILPGGFLNNWDGILYDPEGIGIRPHAVQSDDTPGDLFDNWWTIGGCTHIVSNYFDCGFS